MAEATQAQYRLAQRLKDLRRSWEGVPVTQRHIGEAIGASATLVSSWESASAIPPEDRLKSYARFFATQRARGTRP